MTAQELSSAMVQAIDNLNAIERSLQKKHNPGVVPLGGLYEDKLADAIYVVKDALICIFGHLIHVANSSEHRG